MMNSAEWVSIAVTVGSTFAGSYVALKVAVAKLETKMDLIEKDIDGIAEFIGTPRALARKSELEQKQKDK